MIESPARPEIRGAPPRTAAPRLIAVMPAYNEDATIAGVLDRLYPLVDRLIVVDDGSGDATREVVFDWLADKPHAQLISFNKNRGMSAAYYEAFQHIGRMVAMGQLADDDIILTVDADGQHDPGSLDLLLGPIADGADAVIARRDFRLYPLYKRLGNWVMSAWASLWSGRRFQDVESGYRAFRVGPLLDALRFYKGYRYSETVEVAVILPMLGYRIHDTTLIDIPVFRSRTRMKDVIIDLVAMPCAWWRVMAARRLPQGVPTWFAYCVLPLFFLAALAAAGRILTRTIYLGDDTANNYAHVWYISDRLFNTGHIPIRFAELDGGRAFTFPYALAPWTLNALAYRLFGDWSVTLFLVLAATATVSAALAARPAMRDPWLLVLFLINPFFIDAVANGQYAFLWSAAAFFATVWAVERRRWVLAAAGIWLTASTHPIEGGLAIAAYVTWYVLARPDARRPLLIATAATLPLLAPSLYFALRTPVLNETSWGSIAGSILNDLPRRGSVLVSPFLLAALAPMIRRHYRSLGLALATASGLALIVLSGAGADIPGVRSFVGPGGYSGVVSAARNDYSGYLASGDFRAGAVYRILSPNQKEQGALYVMRRHGVLANEFFSESQRRANWTEERYRCYLAAKHVDRVVVERGYGRQFATNEQALLDGLVAQRRVEVRYGGRSTRMMVYDVSAFRAGAPAPASVKACDAA